MALKDILERFVNGDATIEEVDGWLASYSWERPVSRERLAAGRVNMLVAEVIQGLKTDESMREAVAEELTHL